MKTCATTAVSTTLLAVAMCLFSTLTVAEYPQTLYACEVLTKQDKLGLVRIQANNLLEAEEVALKSRAWQTDGAFEFSRSIVECIDANKAKFADREFQSVYEEMAL